MTREQEIQEILQTIVIEGSHFDAWAFGFEVLPTDGGHLVRGVFTRPDIQTGVSGLGYGRWWHVSCEESRKSIIMTCWMAIEQIVKHELMEAFQLRVEKSLVTVFDPHKSLEDLLHGGATRPGKNPSV